MSKQTRAARRTATKADRAAFRKADAELQENARRERRAGVREETAEYQRLTAVVDDLGRKIGKWR